MPTSNTRLPRRRPRQTGSAGLLRFATRSSSTCRSQRPTVRIERAPTSPSALRAKLRLSGRPRRLTGPAASMGSAASARWRCTPHSSAALRATPSAVTVAVTASLATLRVCRVPPLPIENVGHVVPSAQKGPSLPAPSVRPPKTWSASPVRPAVAPRSRPRRARQATIASARVVPRAYRGSTSGASARAPGTAFVPSARRVATQGLLRHSAASSTAIESVETARRPATPPPPTNRPRAPRSGTGSVHSIRCAAQQNTSASHQRRAPPDCAPHGRRRARSRSTSLLLPRRLRTRSAGRATTDVICTRTLQDCLCTNRRPVGPNTTANALHALRVALVGTRPCRAQPPPTAFASGCPSVGTTSLSPHHSGSQRTDNAATSLGAAPLSKS